MEEPELSTADFIKEAAAAGFSIKDLNQAEIELRESEICNTSPNSSAVGNSYLAKKIVDTMVQRKVRSRISPWRGPLPIQSLEFHHNERLGTLWLRPIRRQIDKSDQNQLPKLSLGIAKNQSTVCATI